MLKDLSLSFAQVDGLIVSRGALVQQATGSRTGFPGPPSGANYQQQQRQQQQQQQQFILSNHNHNSSTLSRGSEMSLPYSSGTLLTSSRYFRKTDENCISVSKIHLFNFL